MTHSRDDDALPVLPRDGVESLAQEGFATRSAGVETVGVRRRDIRLAEQLAASAGGRETHDVPSGAEDAAPAAVESAGVESAGVESAGVEAAKGSPASSGAQVEETAGSSARVGAHVATDATDDASFEASREASDTATDAERIMRQALDVVDRSIVAMAADETRPIPDIRSLRMRRLGDSELAVFPLILGASTFGWTAGADASMAILDAYLEAGGNAIDTADSYSAGRSETVIGTWLRDRGARDRMVLSTKIAQSSENPGLSAQSIARSVDASLQRLGVDYLDLLYFHLDDRAVPLEESLTAADALVRSGKVRYLAASGFDGDRLMQARILAGQLDLPRFVAVQVPYNLLQRDEFEQRLFPVVRAQQLAAVPFSSLASGFLTGKYRGRVKGERGSEAHSRATRAAQFASKRGFRVLDALEDVAEEHDRSLAAVALAWLLTKPLVTAPVVSVSRPEQLADLLTAPRLNLTRHQVALLDRVSAG